MACGTRCRDRARRCPRTRRCPPPTGPAARPRWRRRACASAGPRWSGPGSPGTGARCRSKSSSRHAENAFGDDVALDERRAAGDRRTACLVGEAEPPAGAGGLRRGVVEPELAGERFEREAEVGQVLDQRAEVQLADGGDRARGLAGGRAGDHPLADGVVHQRPRPQVGHLLPDVRVGAERAARVVRHEPDLGDEVVDGLGGVHPAGRDGDPLEGEGAHGNGPAPVDLADDGVVGQEYVVKEDLVEFRLAEHVGEGPDRDALAVHRRAGSR